MPSKILGRILALDVGDRRIGVSISDLLHLTAQPLPTLTRSKIESDLLALRQVIDEFEVEEVVVGMPRNMDGSFGPQARKVEQFRQRLEACSGLPIASWDERLTSVAAKREAVRLGVKTGRNKGKIDQIAAQLILQSYLDYRRNRQADNQTSE